jgi:glycosyltransferase involved in cell wall biosynthesis
MRDVPLVSIVMPCLQELSHIGAALDTVVAQNYPNERLDVLVVDGMSEDGTREIIREFSIRYPFIRLLDNPRRNTPAALNIGIQASQGEVIVRMDAHTTYETDYVTESVRALSETGADVVGGVCNTVPERDSIFGWPIALALSHPFGVGNAYYKIGHTTEQTRVDSVPFGCYRKELFEQIGMFDENVPRNEDTDFYHRVKASGGQIVLVPSIVCYYRARSDFWAFARHILRNGFIVTYFLKSGKIQFFYRHLVPLAFVSTVLLSAGLTAFHTVFLWLLIAVLSTYSLTNFVVSLRVAIYKRNFRYLALLPIVFAVLHWNYGLGSLFGLMRALTSKELWRRILRK